MDILQRIQRLPRDLIRHTYKFVTYQNKIDVIIYNNPGILDLEWDYKDTQHFYGYFFHDTYFNIIIDNILNKLGHYENTNNTSRYWMPRKFKINNQLSDILNSYQTPVCSYKFLTMYKRYEHQITQIITTPQEKLDIESNIDSIYRTQYTYKPTYNSFKDFLKWGYQGNYYSPDAGYHSLNAIMKLLYNFINISSKPNFTNYLGNILYKSMHAIIIYKKSRQITYFKYSLIHDIKNNSDSLQRKFRNAFIKRQRLEKKQLLLETKKRIADKKKLIKQKEKTELLAMRQEEKRQIKINKKNKKINTITIKVKS